MNTKLVKALDQTQTGDVYKYLMETENLIEGNSGIHSNKCLSLDAYDPPCPTNKGVYTKIKLTDESIDVVDIDKSSLYARLFFRLNASNLATQLNAEYADADTQAKKNTLIAKNKAYKFFVGFKSAIHFIDGYRLYSNGKKVCEQTEALYENTLERMLKAQEELDEKPYVYTTWDKANDNDDSVCGAYFTMEDIRVGKAFNGRTPEPGVVEVEMQVIVPLDDFLPLSGMTMFPSCAFGNLYMDLKLAIQNNLVVCQCDPLRSVRKWLDIALNDTTVSKGDLMEMADHSDVAAARRYTHSFTQIGDQFACVYPTVEFESSGTGISDVTWTQANISFDCVSGVILELRSNLNGFDIKDSVKDQIVSRYSYNTPYIIPAQYVDYQTFSNRPGAGGQYRANTTYSLCNCCGIGLLFPRTSNEITCGRNPHFSSVQLQIDNNPYPDKPFSTHEAAHSIYCMTNAGFDGLFSCSREYGHSLRFRENPMIQQYDGTNTLVNADTTEDNTSYCLYCSTERLSGYGTYCDGVSKDSAQISLQATLDNHSPYANCYPPSLLILQDCFWRCTSSGVEFIYNKQEFAQENAAELTQ